MRVLEGHNEPRAGYRKRHFCAVQEDKGHIMLSGAAPEPARKRAAAVAVLLPWDMD